MVMRETSKPQRGHLAGALWSKCYETKFLRRWEKYFFATPVIYFHCKSASVLKDGRTLIIVLKYYNIRKNPIGEIVRKSIYIKLNSRFKIEISCKFQSISILQNLFVRKQYSTCPKNVVMFSEKATPVVRNFKIRLSEIYNLLGLRYLTERSYHRTERGVRYVPIHNKSYSNHALMTLNKLKKNNSMTPKNAPGYQILDKTKVCINIMDCCDFLKQLPDESIQLICIDPPYNLELAGWDIYENYIEWASQWLDEAYRVLSKTGNMIIFGGIQYRDTKSGDLIDIIQYVRHNTKFKLVNTIIWHYKNGMSARRYFANRHEEIIWLTKSKDYYFDLDAVKIPYSDEDLQLALKDKRLNPENTRRGKNPTNVWEIGRLNGNSKERVGHATQKPVEIIERIIKSLSAPGSVVLDFFAGSGTVGRVCIAEGRHCILCDSDKATLDYFGKHIAQMKKLGQNPKYTMVKNVKDFF